VKRESAKPRVAIAFVFSKGEDGRPGLLMPHIGYDYEVRMEEILGLLRNKLPNIDFVAFKVNEQSDVDELVKRKDEFDGFVIYMIGYEYMRGTNVMPIGEAGKPVVFIDDWLAGGDGTGYGIYVAMRKRKLPVIGVSSSDFKDVIDALRLFKVIKRMSESKILLIIDRDRKTYMFGEDLEEFRRGLEEIFGTKIMRMDEYEFSRLLEEASDEEAEKIADAWIKGARRVVKTTRDEIVKAAKLYIAMKKAIELKGADALSTDMPAMAYAYDIMPDEVFKRFYPDKDTKKRGVYGFKKFALPCLGVFQLLSEGFPVGCEMNLYATVTLLLMHYLTEELTGEPRPGFTGGRIFDFARERIIYHLCTAPYKMFGPSGPANPYEIRCHGDIFRVNAAPQSFMPLGEKITAVFIDPIRKVLVMHGGVTDENITEDKFCTNKLAIKADVERILENYGKGTLHPNRTIFYGDWRKPLRNLAVLLGLKVVEEDRD